MLRRHEPLILNWFRAKGTVSAGVVEGLNNKAFRNAALNWLRHQRTGNLAAKICSFTRNPQRLLTLLDILN